jgi:hypothetical protein
LILAYIIEQRDEERESVATRRLLEAWPLRTGLFPRLGVGEFSWFIAELRLSTLGLSTDGEIDIIAGRLAPTDLAVYEEYYEKEVLRWPPEAHPDLLDRMATKRFVDDGGIAWPPPTDYLVGVEVKCAYIEDGTIRSAKSSASKVKRIRAQLCRDLELGLDRVALLDILASEPVAGVGSDAWLVAGARARDFLEQMRAVLARRLPENSPVGHWVWSVGAVAVGHETARGAGGPLCLREALPNPRTATRTDIAARLVRLLGDLPQPRVWPVLLTDCRVCGRVHASEGQCARV